MRVINLGSGSKGNCTIVEYKKDCFFAIDCGVKQAQVTEILKKHNISLSMIKYLFITHNHIDHVRFIYKFDGEMIYSLRNTITGRNYNKLLPYKKYKFENFEVMAIKTSHDAPNPTGYIFWIDDISIAYLTDSGVIPDKTKQFLHNHTYYFLESNYDDYMLLNSGRHPILIDRIRFKSGHLSNEQCVNYLNEFVGDFTKEVFLAHRSEECNDEDIMTITFTSLFDYNKSIKMTILKQHEGTLCLK